MKIEKLMIIFFGFLVMVISSLVIISRYYSKNTEISVDYEGFITSSCNAAMTVTDSSQAQVFGDEVTREKAVDTFYSTLNRNLNNIVEKPETKHRVPCLVLVDTDGFYVEYNEEHTNEDGETVSKAIISPINTWSATYGDYIVQFRLHDTVRVTSKVDDTVVEDTYANAYETLSVLPNFPTSLGFLRDKDKFDTERYHVIVNKVNEQVLYYINKVNLYDTQDINYHFNMPEEKGDYSAKMLEYPCVIAFYQGIQTRTGLSTLNAYALSGGEKTEAKIYYMAEDNGTLFYYGVDDPASLGRDIVGFGTMEQCAKRGAYPDPETVR